MTAEAVGKREGDPTELLLTVVGVDAKSEDMQPETPGRRGIFRAALGFLVGPDTRKPRSAGQLQRMGATGFEPVTSTV